MVHPRRSTDAVRAVELARRLGLEYAETRRTDCFNLVVAADGLALHAPAAWRMKPLVCDFLRGPVGYRLAAGRPAHTLLARALGHGTRSLCVVDATAGLGTDGLTLAALGHRVVLLERHPLIAALLRDGLERARRGPLAAVLERVAFHETDACGWLRESEAPVDVVCLDPMFPERTTRARREMQILQALVGRDDDAAKLLDAALQRSTRRVVVKRPRRAPPLADRSPDHVFEGRSTRLDVYRLAARRREKTECKARATQ